MADPSTPTPTPGDDDKRAPVQLSASLRFEILRRDGYCCTYCGRRPPEVTLTVDHVVPRALGGSDDPSNLVAACKDCNAGKGSTPPDAATVAEVDARSLAYRNAMAQAAENMRSLVEAQDAFVQGFEQRWGTWNYGSGEWPIPRPPHWRQTIINYVTAGLGAQFIYEAITIAMEGPATPKNTWRYFCGVCRNHLDAISAEARRILEAGDDGPF